MPSESHYFVEELEQLGRRLVAGLPFGVASLQEVSFPGWAIFPSRAGSASFGIHWELSGLPVDFFFGQFTTFELDAWKLPASEQQEWVLGEVKKLAQAVMDGRCQERFNLLSVTGIVSTPGDPYRVTHFFHFHPRRFLFDRTIAYRPYV